MYVDSQGRRIWNPFKKIRARIRETEQNTIARLEGQIANVAQKQQMVVQAVREELNSHRILLHKDIEEFLNLHRQNAENIAKVAATLQTLTGASDEVVQSNRLIAAENYGRSLEEFAGEVLEGGLPAPPPGLTGRG